MIIREKLRFPTGTATALMIRVLHGGAQSNEDDKKKRPDNAAEPVSQEETERLLSRDDLADENAGGRDARNDWKAKIRLLIISFSVSAFYVSGLSTYLMSESCATIC